MYPKPSLPNVSANIDLHDAPILFSPKIALTMSIVLPSSLANYWLDIVQIFSWRGTFKYELSMSSAHTSIWNSVASMNTMRALSLDTTLEYVIDTGGSVIWMPATSLSLQVNSPYISMSKIIWHPISWNPGRHIPLFVLSNIYKLFSEVTLTFTIYFWIACSQKLVPVARSISRASLAVFGILITNLGIRIQHCVLTLEIMQFHWCNIWPNNQLIYVSDWIWFAISYSTSSTGLDCLTSFNRNHSTNTTLTPLVGSIL